MKKITLYILFLFTFNLFSQNVNIPDAKLKAALLEQFDLDINGDNEIQVTEAENYNFDLDLRDKEITDLTGIEFFKNVMSIDLSFNSISRVDLSDFSNLAMFNCSHNKVSLTVNISNATSLNDMILEDSNITNLTFSGLTQLFSLSCSNNKLEALDTSSAPSLEILICGNNNFTSIDISSNSSLSMIDFSDNLDLESVNLKNGNNEALMPNGFNCPKLTTVCVDDIEYAEREYAINFDEGVSFVDSCASSDPIVAITDSNFKNALLAHTPTIDLNSDNEIQVSEAIAFTSELNVSNKSISNLTGIEAFINVIKADFSNNILSSFTIESNTDLKDINLDNNMISNVDFTVFKSLEKLVASNNKINSLNVTENLDLEYLDVSFNELQSLNIESNTKLFHINSSNNSELEFILFKNGNNTNIIDDANGFHNFQNSPLLKNICIDNKIYADENFINIDSGVIFTEDCSSILGEIILFTDAKLKAALLEQFDLDINGDNEIQVTEAENYNFDLDLRDKGITDLTGIEFFKNAMSMDLSFNSISRVDLSDFSNLAMFNCSHNKVSLTVNISNATSLDDMILENSNMTSLTFSGLTQLFSLSCSNNKLGALDTSSAPSLEILICGNNNFTSIDISSNSSLSMIDFNDNPDLQYVNLKNGNNENLFVSAFNCPELVVACIDNIDNSIYNYLFDFDESVVFSDNCDFNTTTAVTERISNKKITKINSRDSELLYNTIKGVVKFDKNKNGCDTGDLNFSGVVVKAVNISNKGEFVTLTNSSGEYELFVGEGTFEVSLGEDFPSQHMSIPSETKVFNGLGNSESLDFCSISKALIQNLEVSITPVIGLDLNENETYTIEYVNKGTLSLTGELTVDFESDKQVFISASQEEQNIVGNTITWEIKDLKEGDSSSIDVVINTPKPIVETEEGEPTIDVKKIKNIYLKNISLQTQVLSIQDQNLFDKYILVYPNPTDDKLFLLKENTIIKSYKIFSGVGQLINSDKGDVKTIDLSSFAKGIYLLIIDTDRGKIQKKIILN